MSKSRPPVCQSCAHSKTCDIPCAASEYLREDYADLRTAERRELIGEFRELLDIKDAETAEDIAALAAQIIAAMPDLDIIPSFNIQIGYVRSYENKIKDGRPVYGDCRKVNVVYGAYLPYDFIITLYDSNIALLSDNQIKLLLFHELQHIGMTDRGFAVLPHDVEDFYSILDKYGTRWAELGADVPDILTEENNV